VKHRNISLLSAPAAKGALSGHSGVRPSEQLNAAIHNRRGRGDFPTAPCRRFEDRGIDTQEKVRSGVVSDQANLDGFEDAREVKPNEGTALGWLSVQVMDGWRFLMTNNTRGIAQPADIRADEHAIESGGKLLTVATVVVAVLTVAIIAMCVGPT
jgi:hypothetical protein